MKVENIRILRAFAKYVLEQEHDVKDLLANLRDYDLIDGAESDRLLGALDRTVRCKILLLDILPNKADSALSQLKEAMSREWIEPAKVLQELMDKGVSVEEALNLPHCVPVFSKVPDARTLLKQNWNNGTGQLPKHFTGREEILRQISQALEEKDSSKELLAVCLSGTGGVGKSTIALEFSHGAEDHFSFLAWLRGDSAGRLVEEIESLGQTLGLPKPQQQGSSVPAVKNLLAANPGWLLVVDDLSKDALDVLKKSLPTSGGAVLITSRLQVHADWIHRIEVGELSESVELLEKVIGSKKPTDFETKKQQLASKTLGGLPLAIVHAGSYLKLRPSCTIADYLERFEQSAAILNEDLSGVQFDGEKQVLTTWDVTMEFLRSKNQDTIRYLGICSFFANEIEDGFMNSAPIFQQSSESETKKRVEDAKTLLISFSMLTPMEAGVKIHALVQEAVRIRSSEDEKLSSFANGAVILDKNRDRDWNPDRLRRDFVHGEAMLKKFRLNLANLKRQDASIVHESNYELVATVFLQSVENLIIKLPENFLEGILETGEALFGVHGEKMGEILYWVGLAFGVGGNHEKKREFLEKALKLREDFYGLNHFKVATTRLNLGFCFYQLGGDPRRAIEILEKALEIFLNFHEEKQKEIADTLRCLGFCYGELGEHQKEKEMLEKSREIIESLFGPNHINLAPILSSLGNCYESFGDFQKMKEMYEASLKISEGFYGKDHVEVAHSLVNISVYYNHTGDHNKEKELLERALNIRQDFYGDINHSHIAVVLNNLGCCYRDLGDFHKAKDMLEKALKMEQSLFGENHFEVGQTLHNLANCFGDLGDYETEREMLERALKIKKSFYGGSHEEVAMILLNLGVCYFCLKNNSQSIVSLERAIEIRKSGFNVVGLFDCYFQMSETLLQISKESNSSEAVNNLREAKLYLEKARSLLQENIENPQLNGCLDEVVAKQKEVDSLLVLYLRYTYLTGNLRNC